MAAAAGRPRRLLAARPPMKKNETGADTDPGGYTALHFFALILFFFCS